MLGCYAISLLSKGSRFECHFSGDVRIVALMIYTDKVDKSADIFHNEKNQLAIILAHRQVMDRRKDLKVKNQKEKKSCAIPMLTKVKIKN